MNSSSPPADPAADRPPPEAPSPAAESAETIRAEVAFAVSGMTCAACVSRLERVLGRRDGVQTALVSLPAERAEVVYDPRRIDSATLAQAIEHAGFGARLIDRDSGRPVAGSAEAPDEAHATLVALRWSLLLTLPLVAQMGLSLGGGTGLPGWLQLLLATPVQFWLGGRFYRGAWNALKGGGANMDVLIALGTSAAYGLSLWLVLFGGGDHAGAAHSGPPHLYFEASALIISFVLMGKLLEARARRATNQAVEALIALHPEIAHRLTADGAEETVPLAAVRPGDRLRVRPGESVPADGEIEDGRAAVDESMLTGEALPRERGPGDPVTGGTLNVDGLLTLRVLRVGAEATLGRLITLVGHAQASKPRIQRLADAIAGWFAFFVLGAAGLTLIGWLIATGSASAAILPAVAVLVVACPCALGLATPTVIAVALGAGARAGILIRDAEALEVASSVTAVVFDKTGTLTESRPRVGTIEALDGDAPALLRRAAALQQGSRHPIAQALTAEIDPAAGPLPALSDFRTIAGRGVRGTVEDVPLVLGNAALMAAEGVDLAPLAPRAAALEAEGQTVVWLAALAPQPRLLGLVALADRLHPHAAAALATLTRRKLPLVLLSGDSQAAAGATAARLGIARVIAEASPEDKIAEIRRLQDEGEIVAMVGDGINDGPALAGAHLGIAVGGGTEVAFQAAAVGLMRDDPRLVPALLDLAAAGRRKMIQNLVWAFSFNSAAIPFAAAGVLGPVTAAAAMTLSSLIVVGNALSLRRWRPEP